MDFIAIDLDKYDVWEAFRQPVPIKIQVFNDTATPSPPHIQLAAAECVGRRNDDVCTYTAQQTKREANQNSGSRSSTRGGTASNTGASAQTGGAANASNTSVQSHRACRVEQGNEKSADSVAANITQIINSKDQKLEHGSILIDIGGGRTIALGVKTGLSGGIRTQDFLAQINASGYDYTQISGMIHSHPRSTNSDTSLARAIDLRNRAPSHSLTRNAGDYAVASLLRDIAIQQGLSGPELADWDNRFTHYIIGPDDVLREYDGAKPPKSIAKENKISDADVKKAEKDAKNQC